jgi:hypothetical protein
MLLADLYRRDSLSSKRENAYNRIITQKGDNDKAPKAPVVSVRIMEAKNSEPEFLEKQDANKGHHMFTFAAEMDQWIKGVKAAGGNKDDMIRIAWDNESYGQSFKSAKTFKGRVDLYWNVLITGTFDQVEKYFSNVTNGLLQRCCFTSIENQEFADVPEWKPLSKQAQKVIAEFMARCDANTYTQPLDYDFSLLDDIADEDFEKEVPCHYEFKPFKEVPMHFIFPTLKAFLTKHRELARREFNTSRDTFRRRTAVRGFRLALLCTQLWKHVGKEEERVISDFIKWWMEQDLEGSRIWWPKYNNAKVQPVIDKQPTTHTLYDSLPPEFSRQKLMQEMHVAGLKCGVDNAYKLISIWYNSGLIDKKAKNLYLKLK